MASPGCADRIRTILTALLLCHLLLIAWPCCDAATDPASLTTNATSNSSDTTAASIATNDTSNTMTSIPSGSSNTSDLPGSVTTIHISNTTTPSVANNTLTTGEIVGIAAGVICGGVFVLIIILCLRKSSGYKKAASAPVTYRKGSKPDRAPLTTKDKDPSPPPDGTEDHFYYDDERHRVRRLDPSALIPQSKRSTTLKRSASQDGDRASQDGEATSVKDGGDDDFFDDEIFAKSAFTDETTNAAIRELSSPTDEELPDLVFKDDFEFYDDDIFS